MKPAFFKSEQVVKLKPLTRLLFQGLWCLADRSGRLKDSPLQIKLDVLPHDKCDPDKMLNDLVEAGLIKRYEVGGTRCIWLPTFLDHQNPHYGEKESKLPSFDSKNQSALDKTRVELGKVQTKRDESGILNPESGIMNPSIAPNGAGGVPSSKPTEPSKSTPLQKVVLAFKMVSGHPLEDKDWDKEFFPRYSKSAASLLRYLKTWQECADCIQWVWDRMKAKNLECRLETVCKYMADYKLEVMERRK